MMVLGWLRSRLLGEPELPLSTWDHPVYPKISEERDGKLWTPGRRPLERDLAKPIEFEVTGLKPNTLQNKYERLDRIEGMARLKGCTIGRSGWDEEIDLLQFHCYAEGEERIAFGIHEIDYDRGTNLVDTWWIECHVSENEFEKLKTATSLKVICTADIWRSGRNWKLSRTTNGDAVGRGKIKSFDAK
jgi:hypothetical protein